MDMNSEFKKEVKDVLIEYAYDNDAEKTDLTRKLSQDLLSEAIERRVKSKFHILKANKENDSG